MKAIRRLLILSMLCAATAGCRDAEPAKPAGTGAREVVAKYYEALAQRDWATAYAQLHADSQKNLDQAAFERRAHDFCKRLEFQFTKVIIRSCDEQGDKAVAQVILSDADGSMKHRYHDGAILQQSPSGWRIVLPSNFGQK